jgi:spermidine synthase
MASFYLYLAVIVSGASVLAIEILGTRIMAPFYGASIYLWSALISVTLAALSVGYAIGGRWADAGTRPSRFCTIIGLAGLWIVIIPWLATPLLAATEPLGLRAAVLASATVLFFPPLALLGMVGPYAIRMKASSLEVVGRTTGNLLAVSTAASVVAALATGFFLIPYVGVHRLTFLIGILLIATAVVGFANRKKISGGLVGLVILFGSLFLGYQVAPAETANPENGVLAVEQSPYGEIRVVDQDQVRYLLIDGGTHTAASITSSHTMLPYVNVLDIAGMFFKEPGTMLTIGLGGGSVVRNYALDGWRVDAVEIDPVVTRMARQYFGLSKDDATVYEMDGRRFLMTSDKSYDVIILDAFGSSYIPLHLMTDEAFGLLHSRLSSSGVLAMNIWSIGWRDEMVASVSATLRKHFSHVLALPTAEPPDQFGNMILLASDREPVLEKKLPPVCDRFAAEYDRGHAWDNRFEPDIAGAPVLTDDLSRIDLWSERVNLASRKELRAAIAKGRVAW